MISYAHNFEDVILDRAFKDKTEGFYVDVGAMDPIDMSVTKHFYERGWRGVNIEPVPRFHAALVKDRPRDVNLCLALGKSHDKLTFYDFESKGVSTLSSEFADYFIQRNHRYKKRPVDVIPLREVCERYCPKEIDFMKIDVEGWEKDILEGGDWAHFRPRVVIIEATKPNSHDPLWQSWEPFLLAQDYLFTYFDGLNRFYVAREEAGLAEHFRLPPNVLDRFESHETFRLREELASLKNRSFQGFTRRLLAVPRRAVKVVHFLSHRGPRARRP
jgi:FkbM family methyltransferase